MYTSDRYEYTLQKMYLYIIATILTALFGGIYEYCSFGVMSFYMMYCFAFPFMLGLVPLIALLNSYTRYKYKWFLFEPISSLLWAFGITTICLGCFLRGALEIYGTVNKLTIVYFIAGTLLLIAGLTCNFVIKRKRGKANLAL